MKKIGLILLMVFCVVGVATSTNTDPAKKSTASAKKVTAPKKYKYLVLGLNMADKDTTHHNVINMDSAQIAAFNSLINDPVPYFKRDSILLDSLNSLGEDFIKFKTDADSGAYSNTQLWVRIVLFSMAFVLIAIVLFLFLRFRGLRDEIIDVVKGSNRIKEWLNKAVEKPLTNPGSKSYDSEIRSLQNVNRDLMNRVAALEDLLKEKERNATSENEPSTISQQPTSRPVEAQKQLYADSIIDGVFSHVKEQENEDTVFVLKLKGETDASITLYRGAINKVLANASYLEGCDKQIIGNNSVEIVREGEAEKGFNGKWKVVSPLKVEIR